MASPTERIGVCHCGEIAERNNWMFREQPVDDVGIDAHMEFIESSGKPKQLLALQIKSGASWFKEKKDGYIIFRNINNRQYNYWTMNTLPCIVVLYNPDDDMCIWQKLTDETIERTNDGKGKGFFVKVPITQVFLNASSNENFFLLQICQNILQITIFCCLRKSLCKSFTMVEKLSYIQRNGSIRAVVEETRN